jgi:hypothetical protein
MRTLSSLVWRQLRETLQGNRYGLYLAVKGERICLVFDIFCTDETNEKENWLGDRENHRVARVSRFSMSSMRGRNIDLLLILMFGSVFSHTTFQFWSEVSNQALDDRDKKTLQKSVKCYLNRPSCSVTQRTNCMSFNLF